MISEERTAPSITKAFQERLLIEIAHVWYSEHRMDNGFLSRSWQETAIEMDKRGYSVRGICFEPEYRPQMGYALSFYDKNGDAAWVHVPESFMTQWLMDMGLTPPDDIIWDRAAFRKYIWRKEQEEVNHAASKQRN